MYRRNIIQQWIKDGEGATLDFKLTITSPAKIARSIVAFANSRGGRIVVGVEDHGHIVGIRPDEEKYELNRATKMHCDPPIELEYEEYEVNGKLLLIVHVRESLVKPHFVIDKKGRRKIYVRIDDECVVPDPVIQEVIVKGDLNNLQRNFAYTQLKRQVKKYLQEHHSISIETYMNWKQCSERSAKRSLFDLMFEGIILPQYADRFDSFVLGKARG